MMLINSRDAINRVRILMACQANMQETLARTRYIASLQVAGS